MKFFDMISLSLNLDLWFMDFYIAFQCGFNPSPFCIRRVRYCLFFGIRTGDASRQVWKRSHISAVLDIRGKYHFVRKRIIEISIITMLVFYHCYEGINFSEIYLRGCY